MWILWSLPLSHQFTPFLWRFCFFKKTFKRSFYVKESKAKFILLFTYLCMFASFQEFLQENFWAKVLNTGWKLKFSADLLYSYTVTNWEFMSVSQLHLFCRQNFMWVLYYLNLGLLLWGRVYRNFWSNTFLDSLQKHYLNILGESLRCIQSKAFYFILFTR